MDHYTHPSEYPDEDADPSGNPSGEPDPIDAWMAAGLSVHHASTLGEVEQEDAVRAWHLANVPFLPDDLPDRDLMGHLAYLGYGRYMDYLASPHWQSLRNDYRTYGLPMCAVCGDRRYELHHISYANLGDEDLWDVYPLCRAHHEAAEIVQRIRGLWIGAHVVLGDERGRVVGYEIADQGVLGMWVLLESGERRLTREMGRLGTVMGRTRTGGGCALSLAALGALAVLLASH
jgi:hypothetical protein